MYCLPQAGIIAQQLLEKWLQQHGYHQSTTTPGLYKQETQPVSFTLVVNDFEVKYVGKENTQHLQDTVQQFYKFLHSWDGKQYCGLIIKCDYYGQKVHLSMPNYLKKSPFPVPAPSSTKTAGSIISPYQANIWGKKYIFTSRRQVPHPQQGWKEIHSGAMRSISLPCTCS